MCGICGIIERRARPSARHDGIRGMMAGMKHRGPDDEGLFIEDQVCLGFVRLSIIDLSTAGHQPMLSPDGRFVLVFNGEIYNYLELRKELEAKGTCFQTRTDAEVLLAAYQAWGEACMHRFNGMWAFAIYDRREKVLFCARDRFGVKPFYYYLDDERLVFASEIPPLLPILSGKPEVNELAVYDYLVFNRTDQGEATFFKGIKKLQHGHMLKAILHAERGLLSQVRISQWYDLRSSLKEPFRSPEEFREILTSAIGLRLRSDVPVGVCLSGGLDSSSIVSILLKDYEKRDLNTFSAIYGRGRRGDESEYIDLFRSEPLRMHVTTPTAESLYDDLPRFVRAIGEPVPTPSPYAQFKVMELAKGKVVVTLDGQGADEGLAGYHYFFGFYFKGLLRRFHLLKLASESFRYLFLHRSLLGLKSFAYFMMPDRLRGEYRERSSPYMSRDFADRLGKTSAFSENLYGSPGLKESLLNHFEFKLEHLLKWEDRNSMAFSMEARVPFLDYRLVERTLSLPEECIIRKGMNKAILREAMRGALDERIRLRRDKIGFDTPMEEWLASGPFPALVVRLLDDSYMARLGIISSDEVRRAYSVFQGGKIGTAKEIWKWINLEIWCQEFLGA